MELQLRIRPESPPEVKEQRRADIEASAAKLSDIVGSASKLLEDSVETWTTLQEHPKIGQLQETIRQKQAELDAVKAAIKTLPPMEKMVKVKRSNEPQHEIELCRVNATEVENDMQPLIREALELSTAVHIQLQVLKEYQAFTQQKADETSAKILQEVVDKEQAADTIMRDLNKWFTILAKKFCLPEE